MICDLHNIAEECVERMRENQEMKLSAAEEKHCKECKNATGVVEAFGETILK